MAAPRSVSKEREALAAEDQFLRKLEQDLVRAATGTADGTGAARGGCGRWPLRWRVSHLCGCSTESTVTFGCSEEFGVGVASAEPGLLNVNKVAADVSSGAVLALRLQTIQCEEFPIPSRAPPPVERPSVAGEPAAAP